MAIWTPDPPGANYCKFWAQDAVLLTEKMLHLRGASVTGAAHWADSKLRKRL